MFAAYWQSKLIFRLHLNSSNQPWNHMSSFWHYKSFCILQNMICLPEKPSVLFFHETTPLSVKIGTFFEKYQVVLLPFGRLITTWQVFRQFLCVWFFTAFTASKWFQIFTFQKWHEELTLCKDKISAISWVPVPQISSLRGEVDALTKTLQAKSVSKSHHLSRSCDTLPSPTLKLLVGIPKHGILHRAANQCPYIFGKSQGVAKKLERTWPTHFDTNQKRS